MRLFKGGIGWVVKKSHNMPLIIDVTAYATHIKDKQSCNLQFSPGYN